jgi:hypothetical protein
MERVTDLAEIHALDTFASQGRTDRRTGTGLAGAHNELDELVFGEDFAGHCDVLCCATVM